VITKICRLARIVRIHCCCHFAMQDRQRLVDPANARHDLFDSHVVVIAIVAGVSNRFHCPEICFFRHFLYKVYYTYNRQKRNINRMANAHKIGR
jgi:hypothetical protein